MIYMLKTRDEKRHPTR